MEIDLHDKTTTEAINFFIEKYNEAIKNNYKHSIYVIHGYGSSGKGGKIKRVFHNYIKENTQYLKYEFDSNPGAVIIYPKQPLPTKLSVLEEHILEFCSNSPKSLSKIESNFFKQASVKEIKKLTNSLVKRNLLKKNIKKNIDVYQSIK